MTDRQLSRGGRLSPPSRVTSPGRRSPGSFPRGGRRGRRRPSSGPRPRCGPRRPGRRGRPWPGGRGRRGTRRQRPPAGAGRARAALVPGDLRRLRTRVAPASLRISAGLRPARLAATVASATETEVSGRHAGEPPGWQRLRCEAHLGEVLGPHTRAALSTAARGRPSRPRAKKRSAAAGPRRSPRGPGRGAGGMARRPGAASARASGRHHLAAQWHCGCRQ